MLFGPVAVGLWPELAPGAKLNILVLAPVTMRPDVRDRNGGIHALSSGRTGHAYRIGLGVWG